MDNILYARDLSKSYGEKTIFKRLDIHVKQGETVALLGPSGIGKTTLLNILSGLERPDCGQVVLEGRDITGVPGHISYMQQKDLLLPYYTIAHNVALPLIIKGEDKKTAVQKVREYFDQFGIGGYEDKYPCQLSGGMRQRAALLRTYMGSRRVVLLDEPFGALDAVTRRKMQKWYSDIAGGLGLSTVIITHDTDEALILADRIYVMRDAMTLTEIDVGEKPMDYELTEDFLRTKKKILEFI